MRAQQLNPKDVLFLSDNIKEVDAAIGCGMQSIVLDRPGNAPLSKDDRERLTVVGSLDEIDLKEAGTNGNDISAAPKEPETK